AILIVDVHNPKQYDVLKRELNEANIRVSQQRPNVRIKKTAKGGIKIGASCKLTRIDEETIKTVLREFKITNADVIIRENIDIDQFIDCVEDNKKYMPGIIVINKIDEVSPDAVKKAIVYAKADLAISAKEKTHLQELKDLIFDRLGLMRIFLKEPGKKADMDVPIIAFKNSSIEEVCNKIHKDFSAKFKFARVSGKSAKFSGQKVSMNHKLEEGDILEVHLI
ncbi:MAG: TGS domain-containing protein, partial [Candidatus Woesearchaeota archaeon]